LELAISISKLWEVLVMGTWIRMNDQGDWWLQAMARNSTSFEIASPHRLNRISQLLVKIGCLFWKLRTRLLRLSNSSWDYIDPIATALDWVHTISKRDLQNLP